VKLKFVFLCFLIPSTIHIFPTFSHIIDNPYFSPFSHTIDDTIDNPLETQQSVKWKFSFPMFSHTINDPYLYMFSHTTDDTIGNPLKTHLSVKLKLFSFSVFSYHQHIRNTSVSIKIDFFYFSCFLIPSSTMYIFSMFFLYHRPYHQRSIRIFVDTFHFYKVFFSHRIDDIVHFYRLMRFLEESTMMSNLNNNCVFSYNEKYR
jgi:hypothetical protein